MQKKLDCAYLFSGLYIKVIRSSVKFIFKIYLYNLSILISFLLITKGSIFFNKNYQIIERQIHLVCFFNIANIK